MHKRNLLDKYRVYDEDFYDQILSQNPMFKDTFKEQEIDFIKSEHDEESKKIKFDEKLTLTPE